MPGLRSRDEVLVPINTFSAIAAAVISAGGRSVLAFVVEGLKNAP